MLSSTDLIALNLSLFQLPLPSLTPPLPHTDFSSSDRQSFLDTLFRNASENLRSIVPLSALLPALSNLAPSSYIENFSTLCKESIRFYGLRPRCLLTGTSYQWDDLFKMRAALMSQHHSGSYFILQHGGNMGLSLFNQAEDHQLLTANIFLTWGWNSSHASARSFYSHKRLFTTLPSVRSDILFLTSAYPRYFYSYYSAPIGFENISHLLQLIYLSSRLLDTTQFRIRFRCDEYPHSWSTASLISQVDPRIITSNVESTSITVISRMPPFL